MNDFNVNYTVAGIHEKILSRWAMKEVKMLLNAVPQCMQNIFKREDMEENISVVCVASSGKKNSFD